MDDATIDKPGLSDADRATARELSCVFSTICELLRHAGRLGDYAHILMADPDPWGPERIAIDARELEDMGWVAAALADSFGEKCYSGEDDDE